MFEWLGLCVFGLPCPLKRALINDYFINQEVLAGSKRLWGQGSAEVLNQFPNPPRLDIFCFLAARRFIIILPLRHNGRGREGELDVKEGIEDERNRGSGGQRLGNKCFILCPLSHSHYLSILFFSTFTQFLQLPPSQLRSLDTRGALNTGQAHSPRPTSSPKLFLTKLRQMSGRCSYYSECGSSVGLKERWQLGPPLSLTEWGKRGFGSSPGRGRGKWR